MTLLLRSLVVFLLLLLLPTLVLADTLPWPTQENQKNKCYVEPEDKTALRSRGIGVPVVIQHGVPVEEARFDLSYPRWLVAYVRTDVVDSGTCTSTALTSGAIRVTCSGLSSDGDGVLVLLRFRTLSATGNYFLGLSNFAGDLLGCDPLSGRIIVK